jgi:hypothetical protein
MDIRVKLLSTIEAWNIDAQAAELTDEQAIELAGLASTILADRITSGLEDIYPGAKVSVVCVCEDTGADGVIAYGDDGTPDERAKDNISNTIRGAWELALADAVRIFNAKLDGTLYDLAEQRVREWLFEPMVCYCLNDWPQGDEHLTWLLWASRRDILNWIPNDLSEYEDADE